MVPIVEPEVIMDGSHSVDRCHEVTVQTLLVLFEMLDKKNVNIKGTLLKPNMVVSGTENNYQAPIEEVAEKTPERIFTMPIDINDGISNAQVRFMQ